MIRCNGLLKVSREIILVFFQLFILITLDQCDTTCLSRMHVSRMMQSRHVDFPNTIIPTIIIWSFLLIIPSPLRPGPGSISFFPNVNFPNIVRRLTVWDCIIRDKDVDPRQTSTIIWFESWKPNWLSCEVTLVSKMSFSTHTPSLYLWKTLLFMMETWTIKYFLN